MLRHITNLPNLFTSASIFCGFYSITLAAEASPSDSESLYKAALAILFAGLFDGLDGRIARMTKSESEFGLQLDSLADVLSFGMAPAFLLYRWGLAYYGGLGLFIAFLYVAAGAMRLARFNIITKKMSNKWSMGLTITESGALVAGLIILDHRMRSEFVSNHLSVVLLSLLLSYLMISTVRFRTFKDLKINQRSLIRIALLFMSATAVLVIYHEIALVFVFMMAAHIGSGLIEEVIFFKQRRLEERQELLMEELTGSRVAVGYIPEGDEDEAEDA
jgi:CDP-diacylglycerol--serine O-phosphatidyltransferase